MRLRDSASQRHLAAAVSELDGVAEQVDHDLLDACVVPVQSKVPRHRGDVHRELDALGPRLHHGD